MKLVANILHIEFTDHIIVTEENKGLELDLNIKTHNYKNIVDFATMITNKGNNLKALHLMNFLLDNMPEEVNKDMNTKLINVTKKLKDYFKLEGHDIKQYFKRGILIFSKWKIIQI